MYFKLAFRNVKRSYQDYLVYFITLLFSVAIFYTFNSFDQQEAILDLDSIKLAMFETIKMIMSILSVSVAIVCGFLILYANNFLIKRRKKELGLYMTLGMKDRTISKILVYETFIIGIASLFSGLFLGYFISQGITLFSAKLMQVNVNYRFVFSGYATILTIISFAFIFVIVMFFNTRTLRNQKLIDLLRSDRVNQDLKLKNTKLAVGLFILSLCIIGFAYYIALVEGLGQYLIHIVVIGSVGTLLFYYSLSGFMLQFIQSRKKSYYKNLNIFVMRQVSAKINSTTTIMSVICIMLLIAVGAVATGMSMNTYLRIETRGLERFDTTILYNTTKGNDLRFNDLINYNQDDITDEYYYTKYDAGLDLSNLRDFANTTKGQEALDEATHRKIHVVPYSEFNHIMELHDVGLPNSKANYLVSFNSTFNSVLKSINNASVNVYGKSVKIDEVKTDKYLMSAHNDIDIMLVVPDETIPSSASGTRIWSMKLKDGISSRAFAQNMQPKLKEYSKVHSDENFFIEPNGVETIMSSREDMESGIVGLMAMMTYIGFYLGIIFLMSSSVILALQQLSEMSENKRRFQILKDLGASQRMIRRSIFSQIAIYFGLPLILALVHFTVGINVVMEAAQLPLEMSDMILPILVSVILLLIFYGLYFMVTYSSSKRIVEE